MKTPREIAESIVRDHTNEMWRSAFSQIKAEPGLLQKMIAAAIEEERKAVTEAVNNTNAEWMAESDSRIEEDESYLKSQGLIRINHLTEEAIGTVVHFWVAPPKGHLLTDDGVVRKVLGQLRLTADGCAISDDWDGASLYLPRPGGGYVDIDFKFIVRHHWGEIERYYSTPEAAKNAANKEAP